MNSFLTALRTWLCLSLVLTLTLLSSCTQTSTTRTSSLPLHWEALADRIILQSKLSEGERVIMLAAPGEFDPLIEVLGKKIKESGALYVGTVSVDSTQWPESWKTDTLKAIMQKPNYDTWMLLDKVTLGIMLPGASPNDKPYAMLQDALRQGAGRTVHFHWIGAFDLGNNPLPITSQIHEMYQKAVLDTDYESLAAIQSDFEKDLRKDWVTVTTPGGTALRFRIGDRPVTRQDGDASFERTFQARNLIDREVELPAGAVRVAPLEETVNGVIAFPDGLWGRTKVKGLKLTFKDGIIVGSEATQGGDSVKFLLDKYYNNRFSFRELAVGFNPLLKVPSDQSWIPYYGYGAGVVRLSIGDNEELGGEVRGDFVRISLFIDATVTAGGATWVNAGTLGSNAAR